MNTLDKAKITAQVLFGRPIAAVAMLARHKHTIEYLRKQGEYQHLLNFIFTTFFIRGEDCGKGILDPIWKNLPRLTPFVWDIEVEITTRCYLRCIHCEHTYWKDKAYLNQDLSLEEFIKLIDSLPNLKWINMTGEGSSFLNNDFYDMLLYARSKNIYIDFTHDFYYMPDKIARELIALDIDRIFVSLDGATKETYEKVRIGSDFDKVVANIKRFVQLKKEANSPLPELCFRYSFFKDNMGDIDKLPDLINELSLGDVKNLGDEPSINIVGLLEFTETKGWVQELNPLTVESVNLKAKEYGQTVYWSHPSHDENKKAPMDYCTFWSEPYIMIGGYVLPCCGVLMSNKRNFLMKHAFGNLKQSSLKAIWNTERYRKFRSMVTNPNAQVPILCAGCRSFNTSDRIKRYGVSKEV